MRNISAPKTIRQYLNYVSAVCFSLGLLNYVEQNKILRSSKVKSIVSLTYLIFFVSFFFYHYKLTYSKFSQNKGNDILILYCITSGTFVTSLIVFSGALSSEKACHLANRLLRIDEKYFTSNPQSVNSMSFKYLCINLTLIFTSIIFDYCYFSFDSPLSIVSVYVFLFYTFITVSTISVLLFWLKKSTIKFRAALFTFVPVEKANGRMAMNPIFDVKHQVIIEVCI